MTQQDSATLYIRIRRDLKDDVESLARETGLSQRTVIEQLIARALGREPTGLLKLSKLLGER